MKKYELHVQLSPRIHEGEMKFYWHIDLHTADGQFTVASGWHEHANLATSFALSKAKELGMI